MNPRTVALLAFVLVVGATVWWAARSPGTTWNDTELALIDSLWLGNLPPLPADPTNAVADDPIAASLGHRLFFDPRMSANGAVSCATCHKPELQFTDGLPLGIGVTEGKRNTMGLVGVAYSAWYFWDGRKDSQWSQALGPLENELEHATTRVQAVRVLAVSPGYRADYERLFGALPDFTDSARFPVTATPLGDASAVAAWEAMTASDRELVNRAFANLGKALAAYQRRLMPGETDFDRYAAALRSGANTDQHLSGAAQAGLKLFIGRASCVNCHNGPLLTNNEFHNTGVLPAPGQLPAMARTEAVREALNDPFNCLGPYSDDNTACAELLFAKASDEQIGARRTPSLRGVAETAPYMHAGQIATLEAVLDHYNLAQLSLVGHNEAKPLNLRATELRMLREFLLSLSAPIAADSRWLAPPS